MIHNNKEAVWTTAKLVTTHNHEFAPPDQRHLLHSMRNVSIAKGGLVSLIANADISVQNIWGYLVK